MERLLLPKNCFLANISADSAAETHAGQNLGPHSMMSLCRTSKAALTKLMHALLSRASMTQVEDVSVTAIVATEIFAQPMRGMLAWLGQYLTVVLSNDCRQALAPSLGLPCAGMFAAFCET